MSEAPALPLWAALIVSALVIFGALVTLIGSAGLLRLNTFYSRTHAPSLGATLGTGAILIGSILCGSVLHGRLMVHEVLIGLFLTITTPVMLMLLARAALYRDRVEGDPEVPPDDAKARLNQAAK